jgi:hypothetical protein
MVFCIQHWITRVLMDIQLDLSFQPESSSESKGDSAKPTTRSMFLKKISLLSVLFVHPMQERTPLATCRTTILTLSRWLLFHGWIGMISFGDSVSSEPHSFVFFTQREIFILLKRYLFKRSLSMLILKYKSKKKLHKWYRCGTKKFYFKFKPDVGSLKSITNILNQLMLLNLAFHLMIYLMAYFYFCLFLSARNLKE